MAKQTSRTKMFVLIQAILWFSLPMLGSCATRSVHSGSFDNWRRLCNCSCLGEVSSKAKRFRKQDCTREEIFKIDEEGNLLKSNAVYNLLNLTPGKLTCSTNVRGNFQFFLIKLKCTEQGSSNNPNKQNIYAIYRKRRLSKSSSNDEILQRPSTSSTENAEKTDTSGKLSSEFVIGLSVGLGLFTALVVCLICICCRRRKKTPKKEPNQPNDYIDEGEGEDSSPYRILDLSTNISCDSSGYTFLEASKRDEEKPYQKLVAPPCNRTEKKISCPKKEDIELAAADEPVYFLLEGKPAANCS